LKPDYVDALALSGAIRLDQGDFAEAEKSLRKAVSINNKHYNAIYDLGRLLFKTKRGLEALNYFQIAAKIKPDNPEVHYQLFLVYTRLKRKTEADQEFELFKQLTDKAATQSPKGT